MSRTLKLTWQAGRDGRSGRWRKKYRGKVYYFSGGRGKSDREAYDDAVKQWELEKLKADAAAPRKYQAQYETEIGLWDQVHNWATRHGDSVMAQLAFDKRAELSSRLEAPILKPLSADDRFGTVFEPVTIKLPDNLFEQSLTAEDVAQMAIPEPRTPERSRELLGEIDGSNYRIEKAVWEDRLKSQQRRTVIRSQLVDEHIQDFLKQKQDEVKNAKLSLGRSNVIRVHLTYFGEWIGKDAVLTEIDGRKLRAYRDHLLQLVNGLSKKTGRSEKAKSPRLSTTTAKEYLSTVKSFIRWLWELEAISSLPRILGTRSKSLQITAESRAAVIYENSEVKRLLDEATGRTKLFILLMLNCAMTQKDISDLKKSEVDLTEGRIIRKRSKTESFESVPTVSYILWPDTAELLNKFLNQGEGDRALVNASGSSLWSEQINAAGKYGKSDNIRNAFSRLTQRLSINKPLKSLKKTSSSKLRDNERFNGIEDLFLGHAPQKMSAKHYTTTPQKLLDAAICWLATEYALESPVAQ